MSSGPEHPLRTPFVSLTASEELAVIRAEQERQRLQVAINFLTETVTSLVEDLETLGRSRAALSSQVDHARWQLGLMADEWKAFLAYLPHEFGGTKVTRQVECPVCKGVGVTETRKPILSRETCWRCNGRRTIFEAIPIGPRVDLTKHLPKGLSHLQKQILLVTLAEASANKPFVSTKMIRHRLRQKAVGTTDVGFSRSLSRLDERGLIHRGIYGPAPRPGTRVRTVSVTLTPTGELAAHALRSNG
jgi:hypothetical protein